MKQELTKQELKDVADVMVETRVVANPHFFSKKRSILYCVLVSVLLFFGSMTLAQLNTQLGQFCLMVCIITLAMAVYIYINIRGMKKDISKMVTDKIGKPIEVVINKEYIRYNKQNFAYTSLDRAFEYNGLFYLTFGQNFMIVKSSPEIMKVVEEHPNLKYVRYKRPFNLFSKD